jgi:hypothetical protein
VELDNHDELQESTLPPAYRAQPKGEFPCPQRQECAASSVRIWEAIEEMDRQNRSRTGGRCKNCWSLFGGILRYESLTPVTVFSSCTVSISGNVSRERRKRATVTRRVGFSSLCQSFDLRLVTSRVDRPFSDLSHKKWNFVGDITKERDHICIIPHMSLCKARETRTELSNARNLNSRGVGSPFHRKNHFIVH